MKKEHIFLLICAAIFISCSVGLYYAAANTTTAHEDIDSPCYGALAKSLMQTKVIPVTALGYPIFLSILYAVFGYSYWWIVLMQVCLSLLSGFLLYRIASYLFNQRVALITAALFSVHLGFLVFAQFILTDILLATLLIAGFERFMLFFKNKSFIVLSQSAFFYGLSVIVKPVALFYIFLIVFFLLFFLKTTLWVRLKAVAVVALIFYSFVLGYMTWNKVQYNTWVVAPLMHQNLYMYFLPKLIMEDEQSTLEAARQKVVDLLDNKPLNDSSRWQKPHALLINYSITNPLLVIKIWLANMGKTLFGLYTNQVKFLANPALKGTEISFFQKKGIFFERIYAYLFEGVSQHWFFVVVFLHILWIILYYCSIIIALIGLVCKKEYSFLGIFILSIIYFLFITGPDGYARYRMMSEGLLIILAAYGLSILFDYCMRGVQCKKMMC